MASAAVGRGSFPLLLLGLVVTSWAQQRQENPFLIQQKQNRQQLLQKLHLQQIQEEQLHVKPLAAKSSLGSAPRRSPQPSHHHQHRTDDEGRKGAVLNRNEMHKGSVNGGPGPTPWTRWTPRPRLMQSPWKGQHKGSGDTAVCGGRGYSPRDHICCQNNLHKRQGLRPACCGSLAFDFVFSLCCDGTITPRTAGRPFC